MKQHPPDKDVLYTAYYDEMSKDPGLSPKEVVEKVSQRVTELDKKGLRLQYLSLLIISIMLLG